MGVVGFLLLAAALGIGYILLARQLKELEKRQIECEQRASLCLARDECAGLIQRSVVRELASAAPASAAANSELEASVRHLQEALQLLQEGHDTLFENQTRMNDTWTANFESFAAAAAASALGDETGEESNVLVLTTMVDDPPPPPSSPRIEDVSDRPPTPPLPSAFHASSRPSSRNSVTQFSFLTNNPTFGAPAPPEEP